jgi:hypothetical protein
MSFETIWRIEVKEKQKIEKKENKLEKKERLIIFWLKQKVSYLVLKTRLREINSIKKEIEEINNKPEDFKELYQENKLDLLNKLEEKKKELEQIAYVIKVEDEELTKICKKCYNNPNIANELLIPHLWYKPTYPIWIELPLPQSYLFKDFIKLKDKQKVNKIFNITKQDTNQILEGKEKWNIEQKEKEVDINEIKKLAKETEKLENNFENKLKVFELWTYLISRYLVKREHTFHYNSLLDKNLEDKVNEYAIWLYNNDVIKNILSKYKELKRNKFIFTEKDLISYRRELQDLDKQMINYVKSIHNIYKEWYYEMFGKEYKVKVPRIQIYDFRDVLEQILSKENPSIKDVIISFRKVDKTIPGEKLELSGEIKDLIITYLENYDKKYNQLSEIKILNNLILLIETLNKLNPELKEKVKNLINKYREKELNKIQYKDAVTTMSINDTKIYLNTDFQKELKNLVIKYLIENNKLNEIENKDLVEILKDIYWEWFIDLSDETINSIHNVKDFVVEQLPLLLPALKITKLSYAELLEKGDTELVNKIRLYLSRENKNIVDYIGKAFVKWNIEFPIFTVSYEWLSSIMNKQNEFTLENIMKDYELIVLLHLLDGIKISFVDKLWETKYVSLLNYVKKQPQIIKYILETGVDITMLAQAEKIVKFTFTGEYKLTDEEFAIIIAMVIVVNKLTKTDEVKVIKENKKMFVIVNRWERTVKIPVETKNYLVKDRNEKKEEDNVNIYKAKWWESTVWSSIWRIDLEELIKKDKIEEKKEGKMINKIEKERYKEPIEKEIKEEFVDLLKNLKSIKSKEELDKEINEKIYKVLIRYKKLWIIKDINKQQKRLVRQFKEVLYKRYKWDKLKSELLNKYFWKMVEEIRNNPELRKEFSEFIKYPEKLKDFINSNMFRKYINNIININL